MSYTKPKVLVILGPTASGKSDLALRLAKLAQGKPFKKLGIKGAEIISADSRQVYRGLDLGSGKVSRDSAPPISYQLKAKSYFHGGIPHHLLDVASPKRTFTVSQYQKLGKRAIKDILKRGKLPIICGGTGLYIDALIYDKKFPPVPPNKKLRKELEKLSTMRLFARISALDPKRAETIDPHNRRRLIRALEIIETTGKPVSPQYRDVQHPDIEVLKIGIKLSKEELKSRIEKRLEKRLRAGMVKEVENLRAGGLSWQRLDDFGLEYRFISRYLRGLITKTQMQELITKESLKYAKRQMTWWRKDQSIHWINSSTSSPQENPKEAEKMAKKFLEF